MKKALLMICVIGLLSFATDKYITVKFSEAQIAFHWKNLQSVKKIIDESNLPHAQVKFIIASIDSLQKDINKGAKLDSVAPSVIKK